MSIFAIENNLNTKKNPDFYFKNNNDCKLIFVCLFYIF